MLYKSRVTCRADESWCRDYGRIEGKRPDEVGGDYEQCEEYGRGDCVERVGICVMICGAETAPHFWNIWMNLID